MQKSGWLSLLASNKRIPDYMAIFMSHISRHSLWLMAILGALSKPTKLFLDNTRHFTAASACVHNKDSADLGILLGHSTSVTQTTTVVTLLSVYTKYKYSDWDYVSS